MKKDSIMLESEKFINHEIYPEYTPIDFESYFSQLLKKHLIKKNTYTVRYHAMNILIDKYKFSANDYEEIINITNEHINLLCYLISYSLGNERAHYTVYWGSNKTVANDLGVSTKSIQRWLLDLQKIEFVKVVRPSESERFVYINYGNIKKTINDKLNITEKRIYIPDELKTAVSIFVSKELIPKNEAEKYLNFLINQYDLKCSMGQILNFEKYILLLADKINIDLEAYRKYFDTLIKTYNIKKSQNIATT